MKKYVIEHLQKSLESLAQGHSYFVDPAYKVIDPRPVAEYAKSLLLLGKKKEARRYFDWLVKVQNRNGSWNEALNQEFNEESCVATPIIGRMLLIAYQYYHNRSYLDVAKKALGYIESKEFLPGYFIKSYAHYSDVLNVNATCAAFLKKAYDITKEKKWLAMRDRAIYNVVRYQFKDGAYPYATRLNTFPYEHHLNVRDPHYHALTFYFLLLADPDLSNRYMKISYRKAMKWLKNEFKSGRVDWSHCEHSFAIGVTGAYGYALFCSEVANDHNIRMKILQHIADIQRNDGLFNRFERSNLLETIKGVIREFFEWQTISPKEFSISTRFFRIRKRLARDFKERKNIRVSLYYSTQILDCLTETMLFNKRI